MNQIANNTAEQAMLDDYGKAMDDAIIKNGEAHNNQMMQLLTDPKKSQDFARLIFDMLQKAVDIETTEK